MNAERSLDNAKIPLHTLLRQARRAKGISQASLAAQSGCAQSAISMMELGRHDALAKEKLMRLTELLQVTIDLAQFEPDQSQQGFCPNQYCPSTHVYQAGKEIFLWPRLYPVSELHGRYCRYCGEVMETNCVQCGHAAKEGACCRHCGAPYIHTDTTTQTELREGISVKAGSGAVEFRYPPGCANDRPPVGPPAMNA